MASRSVAGAVCSIQATDLLTLNEAQDERITKVPRRPSKDGSFIRRRPLKQKRLRMIDVLAMLILERLEEHLPDIEERSLKDMMADRRYARVLDRMQLRIDLLGHYIQSEWP